MTYKHLFKLIKENTDKSTFDLTFLNVKSKVIFAVGNGASNVSAIADLICIKEFQMQNSLST